MEDAKLIVEKINDGMEMGKNIVLLSISGLGRSALFAALVLLKYSIKKMTALEVIDYVRSVRGPRAIETKKQEEFIKLFEQELQLSKVPTPA